MLTGHFSDSTFKCPKYWLSEGLSESYSSLSKQHSVERVYADLSLGKAILFILFVPETLWESFTWPGEHITPAGSHIVSHKTSLLELVIIILK